MPPTPRFAPGNAPSSQIRPSGNAPSSQIRSPVMPPTPRCAPPVMPPTPRFAPPVMPPTPRFAPPVMPPTPRFAPPVMPPTPRFAPPVMPPTPRFAPPVMPPASDLKTNIPPPAPPTVKPKPPSPPKFPSPVTEVKTKLPVQANPKPPPTQAPSSLSANQATLLSILQKKMLEMDNKMDKKMLVMKDTECDDWESPLSDEETKVTFGVTKKPPVITPATPVAKTQGLDMKELESKMKAHGSSTSSKGLTSNGAQSKQASGITFTVRPGTKQPITVLNKGDSS
ncbi:hypothetical protein DPEC_G00212180 [Dallia pectoralis]|uniref:Uncharacterized protein n=1 Tax=Dallia pectoralis TaxID=75939 RepID=A0ACC2G6B7_DALPE|nr:hypothetical protein DPEC_G00212180 [Dallia pectoralis]